MKLQEALDRVEQRRRLLMFYAENDAFPDWVFES